MNKHKNHEYKKNPKKNRKINEEVTTFDSPMFILLHTKDDNSLDVTLITRIPVT